ncbi:hypothetical protein NMP99_15170 [Glutamicibacter mishrai]|uniref:hypothetical protein n=1 Tax=Glutamicibacter mishrai TaxID=1775880 RepID=UPI0020CB820A|nr:hypothetical protein [Glutamicibacter mishrai]UTT39335.1 hypothetical protein NMP99_15170 [Glutamicibacter mishrai]
MSQFATAVAGKVGVGRRGHTSHLPLIFAFVIMAVAFFDIVNAILAGILSSKTGEGEEASATAFIASIMRPGAAALVMFSVLFFVWKWAKRADFEARTTAPRPPLVGVVSSAGTVGGIVALVIGLFTVLAIWPDLQAVFVQNPQVAQYQAELDQSGRLFPLPIRLLIAASAIGLSLWLGIQVLRRRIWARYALIGFGISYMVFMALGTTAAVSQTTLLMLGLPIVMSWSLPVSMIWAEISERGREGFLADSWRGLLMLAVNLMTLISYVMLEFRDTPHMATAGANAFIGMMIPWNSLIMMVLAMWAINNDRNESWAGLNASVAVLTPLIASLVAFGSVAIPLSRT